MSSVICSPLHFDIFGMRGIPLQLDLCRFSVADDRLGLESERAHRCGGLLDPLSDAVCRVGVRAEDDPLAAEIAVERAEFGGGIGEAAALQGGGVDFQRDAVSDHCPEQLREIVRVSIHVDRSTAAFDLDVDVIQMREGGNESRFDDLCLPAYL